MRNPERKVLRFIREIYVAGEIPNVNRRERERERERKRKTNIVCNYLSG